MELDSKSELDGPNYAHDDDEDDDDDDDIITLELSKIYPYEKWIGNAYSKEKAR